MPKNIVIFSDGTRQEGGEGNNTNIYNLYNIIENRTDKQISFYDPGVGTGWNKVSGSIGGLGISENIKECYKFISDNFEAGDQIYLFGFSRGAATVRSLASFIHYFGLLPKFRHDLIEDAYTIYRTRDSKERISKSKEFVKKHHTMWIRIKFLGCFDTVSALGVPYKYLDMILDYIPLFQHKFHDFRLNGAVENAYHALAIDDRRELFHPLLWDENILEEYQRVEQVWFCGMHTDIGGGYKESDLSNISLSWIKDKAVQNGLLIYSKNKVFKENINGKMHNSRDSILTENYDEKERFWDSKRKDKPIIHGSVLERIKNRNNEDNSSYNPWILKIDYEIERE